MIIFSDSKKLKEMRKEILQYFKLEAKVCENDEKTDSYFAKETNSYSSQNSTSSSACTCDARNALNAPSSLLQVQSNACYANLCM